MSARADSRERRVMGRAFGPLPRRHAACSSLDTPADRSSSEREANEVLRWHPPINSLRPALTAVIAGGCMRSQGARSTWLVPR